MWSTREKRSFLNSETPQWQILNYFCKSDEHNTWSFFLSLCTDMELRLGLKTTNWDDRRVCLHTEQEVRRSLMHMWTKNKLHNKEKLNLNNIQPLRLKHVVIILIIWMHHHLKDSRQTPWYETLLLSHSVFLFYCFWSSEWRKTSIVCLIIKDVLRVLFMLPSSRFHQCSCIIKGGVWWYSIFLVVKWRRRHGGSLQQENQSALSLTGFLILRDPLWNKKKKSLFKLLQI